PRLLLHACPHYRAAWPLSAANGARVADWSAAPATARVRCDVRARSRWSRVESSRTAAVPAPSARLRCFYCLLRTHCRVSFLSEFDRHLPRTYSPLTRLLTQSFRG